MKRFRVIKIETIHGPLFTVQEKVFYLFWIDHRTHCTLKDALRQIERIKTENSLPRPTVVHREEG
jgi:hypothetical protein